jgi:opacity protein-like surface antigen
MQRFLPAFYILMFMYVLPVFASENPYYIRTDMGISFMRDQNLALGIGTPVLPVSSSYQMDLTFSSVLSGQLGVGYRFSPFYRLEATLQQYMDRDVRGTCAPQAESVCGGQKQKSEIESVVSLLNVYLDFNAFFPESSLSWWNPYVGVGLGLSSNKFEDMQFYQDANYLFEIDTATQGNVAWRLMAGMGFYLTERVILDFWYGFTNAGQTLTGHNTTLPDVDQNFTIHKGIVNVRFEEGLMGFRFLF